VTGESGTPTGWISPLSGRVVEVHCGCPAEVAAERFLARKRHDGHLDRNKRSEDLVADLARLAALGPLGIGPLVTVDTSRTVDLDGVLRQVEEHLASGKLLQ
jgi:hypothetical protein